MVTPAAAAATPTASAVADLASTVEPSTRRTCRPAAASTPSSRDASGVRTRTTERELDVFRLITRGLSNAEISRELYISDTTVKTHITHILQKLNLRDRVQAVVLAYETGLFDADARPPSNRHERPAR
jgi:DNA-binding NarL/FixJ family response regulator